MQNQYSVKSTVNSLCFGYAIFPFQAKDLAINAANNVSDFFSKNPAYKNQFYNPGQIEFGYSNLEHKESFAIRNQDLPSELQNCIPLFNAVSELAQNCLLAIAQQLGWSSHELLAITQKNILPLKEKSASVLRLLNYHPHLREEKKYACDDHQDLGLISIVLRTPVPALEVYDYQTYEWFNIEEKAQPFDAIILVGETLSAITNNHFLPATHRVRFTEVPRLSLVYQLRADPDAVLDSARFETVATGKFSKPFKLTGAEFYNKEKQYRTSVNNSY